MAVGAVVASLVLAMAVHTGAHVVEHLFGQYIAFANRTMAGLASRSRLRVGTVAEEYIRGNLVYTRPVNGLVVLCCGRQLLNVRTVGFHRFVATHAKADCRESHHLAGIGTRVAVLAFQPESDVGLVAVRHRLSLREGYPQGAQGQEKLKSPIHRRFLADLPDVRMRAS